MLLQVASATLGPAEHAGAAKARPPAAWFPDGFSGEGFRLWGLAA